MKINISTLAARIAALAFMWIFVLSISCKKEISSEPSITQPPPTIDTFSIFTNQKPVGQTENDRKGAGIEVGLKFQTSIAGFVDGIRYYKTPGDSGTRTAQLYSINGTLLASMAVSNETDSGWQSVFFDTAIPIVADSTYIAAYYSSLGNYILTAYALKTSVTNGPLTALADSTDGINGLFKYTSMPVLPDSGYLSSNYWVDVIFVEK
jgi:Domain of unknown function (DUF4082)